MTILKIIGVIILGVMLVYEITRNEALEDENGRLRLENYQLWLLIRGKRNKERETDRQEALSSPFEEFENLKS